MYLVKSKMGWKLKAKKLKADTIYFRGVFGIPQHRDQLALEFYEELPKVNLSSGLEL